MRVNFSWCFLCVPMKKALLQLEVLVKADFIRAFREWDV